MHQIYFKFCLGNILYIPFGWEIKSMRGFPPGSPPLGCGPGTVHSRSR